MGVFQEGQLPPPESHRQMPLEIEVVHQLQPLRVLAWQAARQALSSTGGAQRQFLKSTGKDPEWEDEFAVEIEVLVDESYRFLQSEIKALTW